MNVSLAAGFAGGAFDFRALKDGPAAHEMEASFAYCPTHSILKSQLLEYTPRVYWARFVDVVR